MEIQKKADGCKLAAEFGEERLQVRTAQYNPCNHEQSHMGQNYLKCLFALGFQGFLILICVAIYAVLIQSVAISGDAINSIWSIVGYTVLLCFSLFKTSSVTKSVLGAH